MKILLVNKNHFVQGGADRVYLNTGELLTDLGHSVAYFSTKNDANYLNGYSDYFVSYRDNRKGTFLGRIFNLFRYLYNIEARIKLRKLIFVFKPDIIHIHLFYGVLSASILTLIRSKKIPVIVTIHDYRLLCPVSTMLNVRNEICAKCVGGNYSNCLVNRCSEGNVNQSLALTLEAYIRGNIIRHSKYIDNYIFVSSFIREMHIKLNITSKEKSHLLYNFARETEEAVSVRGDYFIYFGRLSREKGLITLINTFKTLGNKLIIVGTGPLESDLRELTSSTPNIEMLGYKSGKELNELIINSAFVIVPSEWYENNPMTVIESFALGKPVIGSNIGGIPELINENNGFLFDSGDNRSLLTVINRAIMISDVSYRELSINCLRWAKEYLSRDNHYKKLMDIYNLTIKNNNN